MTLVALLINMWQAKRVRHSHTDKLINYPYQAYKTSLTNLEVTVFNTADLFESY